MARTSTLEYRRPVSAAADASRISLTGALRRREQAYQMEGWLMLAGGVLALLLAPAVVTAVFAKMQTYFIGHALLASAAAFALAATLLVPPLIWLERVTRGHWLDEASPDGTAAAVPVAGVVELVLWGPRMIVAGWQRRRQTVSANILNDAAATIAYLRHFADDGVGTHELPTVNPEPVVRYLAARQWVSLSAGGRRICLLPEARRVLGFDSR